MQDFRETPIDHQDMVGMLMFSLLTSPGAPTFFGWGIYRRIFLIRGYGGIRYASAISIISVLYVP